MWVADPLRCPKCSERNRASRVSRQLNCAGKPHVMVESRSCNSWRKSFIINSLYLGRATQRQLTKRYDLDNRIVEASVLDRAELAKRFAQLADAIQSRILSSALSREIEEDILRDMAGIPGRARQRRTQSEQASTLKEWAKARRGRDRKLRSRCWRGYRAAH